MSRRAWIAVFLCAAWNALADDSPRQTLDTLLARVTKPVPAPAAYNDAEDQRRAVEQLAAWPAANEGEEARIATALKQARTAPEPNLQRAAHGALGQRNHRELIPEYFQQIENHPAELRSFFFAMPDREKNPPVDFLAEGLRSANPEARLTTLELIEWCKARQLRSEIERLLLGDPMQKVRAQAATTLWRLDCRESIPALREALRGNAGVRQTIGWSLANLGGDAEVEVLAPLLTAKSAETRRVMANGMGHLHLVDPRPAIAALLPLLDDTSREVRTAAIVTLGKLQEPRIVPAIRALLKSKQPPRDEERDDIVHALGAIGTGEAVAVLNTLPLSDHTVQEELLRLGHPSTGYAVWDAYLCDPIRPNPGSDVPSRGDFEALRLLEKLADEEVFRAIRLRAHKMSASEEGYVLSGLIEKLGQRFPKIAAEPIESLTSKAESVAADRDGDGVPDRLDKYPDDPRRSDDIPTYQPPSEVQFPAGNYVSIPLATEGPAAETPLLMALDNENRMGWLTKVNDADPPDYHVASGKMTELEEWPLANPGSAPGIYRLDPAGINSSGTVVGTASRKKVALPLRQDVREAHVTYQSGFIFEKGQLRFDPPPPFTGQPLNVSYRLINNHGLIFGHREMRFRENGQDVFRTCAFLGEQVFREVPPFDVTVLTESGQLLCSRVENGNLHNFVWDGGKFMNIDSMAGHREWVRAYAMNQKLQVVGLSDARDKEGCPIGFIWENGQMRPFANLIPKEYRSHLRSAIPYLINDVGSITFRAEEKAGPYPPLWPKHNFILERNADGSYRMIMMQVSGGRSEE